MHFTKDCRQVLLLSVTFVSSLFFWLFFYFNIPRLIGFPQVRLETVYSNYDGPNYMVIAKCAYDKKCIASNFSLPIPLEYYPAHLPGYPLLIKFFNYFVITPKAMLLATLFGSLLLTFISYHLFKLYTSDNIAFYLSLLLIFFPARLFVLRQIGAPETLFLSTIMLSIYFFKKSRLFLAAVFAALAQLTKSPGLLLLVSYLVFAVIEYRKTPRLNTLTKYLSFILVPITILIIFFVYQFQTGDFFAYFHSGDNFHLSLLPYMVFVSTRSWINTIWLEDVIYIFLIAFIAIYVLYQKFKLDIITVFTFVFTFATVFVAHRDISRYIAPIYPFVFLAFANYFDRSKIRLIFFLLLPAVFLYAVNFVVGNIAPIADWTPYL